jgi:hypothetical protein
MNFKIGDTFKFEQKGTGRYAIIQLFRFDTYKAIFLVIETKGYQNYTSWNFWGYQILDNNINTETLEMTQKEVINQLTKGETELIKNYSYFDPSKNSYVPLTEIFKQKEDTTGM